jgi:endonuclease VIII
MPEGHTLHRLALDHQHALGRRVIRCSSPQGRFAEEAGELDGQRVDTVEAWGKHLFYRFDSGCFVHVHLGLYGRFRRKRQPVPEPRGAIRWRIETDDVCLDLSGPTACELLDIEGVTAIQRRLGPDLLRAEAKAADAWERVSTSRRAIGALLLDQSIMAGVGNVYRAEGLFVAAIHPEVAGVDLPRGDFTRLWKTLRTQLKRGVKDRRIVTVPHEAGYRARKGERTFVYGQRVCRRCDGPVRRWDLGARTMFACEQCQPR